MHRWGQSQIFRSLAFLLREAKAKKNPEREFVPAVRE